MTLCGVATSAARKERERDSSVQATEGEGARNPKVRGEDMQSPRRGYIQKSEERIYIHMYMCMYMYM
jgi:hypothetical protein